MNLRQRSSVPNRDDDFMYPGRLSPPASAAAKPKPHVRQRSVSFGGTYQMGDREAAELLLSVTQPTRDRSMSTESFDALSDVVSRELAYHQKRQRSLTSTSQTMPPPRAPTAAEMSSEFDKLFGGVPKSRPRNDSAASAPARSGDSKIGVYSVSERIARIKRFHDKRDNRVWKKKIRYSCRKNLADRRVRIKGRFVRATPELLNLIDQEGMTPEKAYAIVAGREAAAALGITTPGSSSSGSPGPTRTPSTRRTGVNTRARRSRSEADGALLRGTAFPPLVRPSQIVEEPSDAMDDGGDGGKGDVDGDKGGGDSSGGGDADPELKAAAALLASSAGAREAEGDTEMKAEP